MCTKPRAKCDHAFNFMGKREKEVCCSRKQAVFVERWCYARADICSSSGFGASSRLPSLLCGTGLLCAASLLDRYHDGAMSTGYAVVHGGMILSNHSYVGITCVVESPQRIFSIFSCVLAPYGSVSFPFARSPFDAPPCICLILNIALWMLVRCLARTARQKDWIVVAASFCNFSSWETVGSKRAWKGVL